MYDLYRIAAAVPHVKVADTAWNTNRILEKWKKPTAISLP